MKIATIRLIATKSKHFPLNLRARIVYSLLAFRSRKGLTASEREIARATGLTWRAVGTALQQLAHNGLVELRGKKWAANEPPEGWFAKRPAKGAVHWFDHLAAFPLYLPRKGTKVNGRRFGHSHAAIYFYLHSYGKNSGGKIVKKSAAWIAMSLNGMDRETVGFALTDLQTLGLLVVEEDGTIQVNEIPEDTISYFSEAKAKPKKAAKPSELAEPQYKEPYQSMYYYCIGQGFPRTLALKLPHLAHQAALDLEGFIALSQRAFDEHFRNFREGKVEADHHGFLLRHKLEHAVESQKKMMDRILDTAPIPPTEPSEQEREAERCEQMAEREEIAANPLHSKKYLFSTPDLTARVAISAQEAEFVLREARERCESWLELRFPFKSQFVSDKTPRVLQEILGDALNELNDYYSQETKAMPEQLYESINAALLDSMKPITRPEYFTERRNQ